MDYQPAVWDVRPPSEGASFWDTLLPPTQTRAALCAGAHPVQITGLDRGCVPLLHRADVTVIGCRLRRGRPYSLLPRWSPARAGEGILVGVPMAAALVLEGRLFSC